MDERDRSRDHQRVVGHDAGERTSDQVEDDAENGHQHHGEIAATSTGFAR